MAAGDHVYTWDEISATKVYVNSVDAHRVLSEFREASKGERHPDGTVAFDLPALEVVGHGVTKFELRFLKYVDLLTGQHVLVYIVHRTPLGDFPHVRLHPHR